jgi:hypothetical protein
MRVYIGFSVLLIMLVGMCFSLWGDLQIEHSPVFCEYNVMIGKNSGGYMTMGSYNLCIGNFSCSNITTKNCIIDVHSLPKDFFENNGMRDTKGLVFVEPYRSELLQSHRKHCGIINEYRTRFEIWRLENHSAIRSVK